jgi:acid phosphatase type 7
VKLRVRCVFKHLELPRWNSFAFIALLLFLFPRAQGATPPERPDPNPTFVFSQFAPGKPLHLVAYGDTRFTNPSETSATNPRVRKWLAERIAEEHPQVLLITGDTPYYGAREADWQVFQEETAPWRAQRILELPTTGNHEVYGGAKEGITNYFSNFPEIANRRYYSALLGNVEVISLDCTIPAGISQPQSRWFAAQLEHLPRQVQFLFILYHIPWVADPQTQFLINVPSSSALLLRGILEARLDRVPAKVIVFSGHIHNYERFVRKGVEYVVTGGGGADPYPILIRGRSDLYRDTAFPVYHYLTVDLDSGRLHAVMWKIRDPKAANFAVEAKDEFTMTAPGEKKAATAHTTSPRAP